MAIKQSEVTFTVAQLRYLEELYPNVVYGPNATPEIMHHYFGSQEVLRAIRRRTRGLNGVQDNDIPSPAE